MNHTRAADDSFCIAVLGDFLGIGAGGHTSPEERWKPRRATPETVLDLLGLRPAAHFIPPGLSDPVRIEFGSLSDFGPDSLFDRVDHFEELREIREAIKEGRFVPSPPPNAAEEDPSLPSGRGHEDQDSPVRLDASAHTPEAGSEGPGLLDAILDQSPGQEGSSPSDPVDELDRFVRDIVRPHLVTPEVGKEEALAENDRRASEALGQLLRSPEIRELEAVWRSLVFLLSRADSTGKTKVYVVPVSRSDLAKELLHREDLRDSRLFRTLSEPDLGVPGRSWGLAVGAYTFGSDGDDLGLVQRVAKVAESAEVPWISGASPGIFGLESFTDLVGETELDGLGPEGWYSLRQSSASEWMSLVAPRFLLRERYGEGGLPCKAFGFQEPVRSRADLPWGNGAFLCAALLAQAFSMAEWGFHLSEQTELGGIPLTPGVGGDDPRPSPLESEVSSDVAGQLAKSGLTPLLAFPQQAQVRVGGLRSLSMTGEPLRGKWRRE